MICRVSFAWVAVLASFAIPALYAAEQPQTQPAPKAFFSIDNGKTWFVESADRLPPYEVDKQPAVRAFVFINPGFPDMPFVGYLLQYTAEAKAILQQQKNTGRPPTAEENEAVVRGTLVKRPGDRKWTPVSEAKAMTSVVLPGGRTATPVVP